MRALLFIFAAGFAALTTGRAQPAPATNTVVKPTFITGRESYTAGTAFLCESPDGKRQFMLTAHHLLGAAGGFESELAWDKLNEIIRLTVGLSMDDPAIHVTSKRALPIQGAHALDRGGLAYDLAAFELDYDRNRPVLKLAKTAPKTGDHLWLYGRQRGGEKLELLPCTVVASSALELDYEFDSRAIRLAGTSGAPVLNAEGQVVGINIGGGEQQGKLIGYANPLPSIVSHLQKATAN
jgi:trypsin-like peptidase